MILRRLKKKLNRSLLFVLAFVILVLNIAPLTVNAANKPTDADFSSVKSVVLYNISDGLSIIKYNSESLVHTSTSAKIMTGLILCEKLENSLEETVTVPKDINTVTGVKMSPALQWGEKIKVKDLLYAAICGSYNDAAYALACYVAGGPSEFVYLMNEKAKAIGAESTTYVNILGYPDSDAMKTTGEDVLKIAIAAYNNPLFMEIASTYEYDTEETNATESRHFKNRVNLVTKKDSVYHGMNAGYTGEGGGSCVITSFEDEGHHYISVVLGGENEDSAYNTTKQVAKWVCEEYKLVTLYRAGDVVGKTRIALTPLPTNNAPYVAATDFNVYIPSDVANDLEYEITPSLDGLCAPLKEGDVIGTMKAIYDGRVVGECELVITKDYIKSPFMSGMEAISKYTKSRACIIAVIIFVVLLIIYICSTRFKRLHFSSKMKKK